MERLRSLAPSAYLVALLLVLVPLSEVVLSAQPVRLGDANWRFGAVGFLSRALMTSVLGLLLAAGVALACRQRRTLRTLSVLALLGAILLLLVLPLFGLDTVEVRSRIQPQARAALLAAAVLAVGKILASAAALLLLARGGWRASRRAAREEEKQRAESPILIRQPATQAAAGSSKPA